MVLKSIAKFVLGVFLVFALTGLVVFFSLATVLSEKNIEKNFKEGVENRLNAYGQNLDEIYGLLLAQCESKENITIVNEGIFQEFEIDCNGLKYNGRESLVDFVADEAYKKIEGYIEIEQAIVVKALWIFGVMSLLLIILIILISREKSLSSLGVPFVLAGLPFLAAGFIESKIGRIVAITMPEISLDSLPEVPNLIKEVSNTMFTNFVIVFIIGIVLLAGSFALWIRSKEKGKEKNDH